jgi:hypothetical protein
MRLENNEHRSPIMSVVSTVKSNLSKFVPTALKKRFGLARKGKKHGHAHRGRKHR